LVAKAPEVTVAGEVEIDEVYVVAGHKGRTHSLRAAYRAWVKPVFDLTGVLSSAGKDRRRGAQWRSSPG
jgi:hypothetical protein